MLYKVRAAGGAAAGLAARERERERPTDQARSRRADEAILRQCVWTGNEGRNGPSKTIDWQFETAYARIKRRRLYPQIMMA